MSERRKSNNTRKLSFLGFGTQGDGSYGSGGDKGDGAEIVHLDDEMEDVFQLAEKQKFSLVKLSDNAEVKPKRSMESLQEQHRKKSYPHAHVPLKIREPRRYSGTSLAPAGISSLAPVPTTSNGITHDDSHIPPLQLTSPTTDSFLKDNPNGEPVRSPSLGDIEENLVEKHVQFDKKKSDEDEAAEKDAQRKKKKSRHHAHPPRAGRKYSLQEEPQWKREGRRVSIQPEDETLTEVDIEELDSHRSDDPRGLRRPKTQKPQPGTAFVRIGRKGGNENLQTLLTPTALRKMYDHSPHAVFVQLDELIGVGEEKEWKETARWIKYEEDVEEGSDRWGRPHVATLSFHSLLNLRRCLQSGVVLLDLDEKDLAGVAYRVTEQMVIDELIAEEDKPTVMRSLLMRHKHVNDYERGFKFSLKKQTSYSSLQNISDHERATAKRSETTDSIGSPTSCDDGSYKIDMKEEVYVSTSQEDLKRAQNEAILKRIPEGAEATTVLVGCVNFLEQPTIAFIRLAHGIYMPSITEVTIPVRFMFILLGPSTAELDYHEVGRSISTLMSNRSFHEVAYKAEGRRDLLSAINEFLDDSIVLPPGNWESQALLPFDELKAKSEMIMKRKRDALNRQKQSLEEHKEDDTEKKPFITSSGDDSKKPPSFDPLQRTHRLFGGVINDIKRRYPLYISDLTNGFNGQCFAASIFMYFAALCSAITFGGLLADKTNNLIGISETLLSTSITGICFALLSGQPMMVVGTTGPLLLFDQSLFMLSMSLNISFLTLRLWISIWLAVISAIVACAEGSVLAKQFTRFTEDIFSSLINMIFIMESVMKMHAVYVLHTIMSDYCLGTITTAALFANTERNIYQNSTEELMLMDDPRMDGMEYNNSVVENLMQEPKIFKQTEPRDQPNTALFCTLLTLGTFIIAYYLRIFRNSKFLGRGARRALGDFGVPIAIVIMVTLDYLVPQIYTEKLKVPEGLSPSDPSQRGWFISFGGTDDNPFPVWIMFAAILPALMGYIIIFMETHIAELIVDKPERNLKKGSGFHLDIMVISCLNMICGIIGAPWVCVATVRSLSHVSALTVMSTTHAPGDKPYIIEVKEQRLSALIVSILVGASVSMAFLLSLIPLAVLFGIFLYMGISSLSGIQLFERIVLMLRPVKHHPPLAYVKRVPTWKMHLYTSIQIMCLVLLYWIKSTSASLAFPFLLIMLVPLRAQLKHIFSPLELHALDGKQPELDLENEPDFYEEAPLPG